MATADNDISHDDRPSSGADNEVVASADNEVVVDADNTAQVPIEKTCMICWDAGDDIEQFQPCPCTAPSTSSGIHRGCLDLWLDQTKTVSCPNCKTPYRIHIESDKLSWQVRLIQLIEAGVNHLLPLLLNIDLAIFMVMWPVPLLELLLGPTKSTLEFMDWMGFLVCASTIYHILIIETVLNSRRVKLRAVLSTSPYILARPISIPTMMVAALYLICIDTMMYKRILSNRTYYYYDYEPMLDGKPPMKLRTMFPLNLMEIDQTPTGIECSCCMVETMLGNHIMPCRYCNAVYHRDCFETTVAEFRNINGVHAINTCKCKAAMLLYPYLFISYWTTRVMLVLPWLIKDPVSFWQLHLCNSFLILCEVYMWLLSLREPRTIPPGLVQFWDGTVARTRASYSGNHLVYGHAIKPGISTVLYSAMVLKCLIDMKSGMSGMIFNTAAMICLCHVGAEAAQIYYRFHTKKHTTIKNHAT